MKESAAQLSPHIASQALSKKFKIVSYQPPAKTVKRLATLRYARDNLVIISFDLTDLKSLVNDRANLLEMIERKRDEIATNAVSDLKEIGVFTS